MYKVEIPGGRYWEPMEEKNETESEWKDFLEWIKSNELYNKDLPFN